MKMKGTIEAGKDWKDSGFTNIIIIQTNSLRLVYRIKVLII